jgi:RNA-directed DNA polymerase
MLLKMREFDTVIANSQDYRYGSKDLYVKNILYILYILYPKIYGETFIYKCLWGGARFSRNCVSPGGVVKTEYGSRRRWASILTSNSKKETTYYDKKICCDIDALCPDMAKMMREMKSHKAEILKSIRSNIWPEPKVKYLKTLALLQKTICVLSLANKDEEAMSLISIYHSHIVIRYLAINRISSQSGKIAGTDGMKLVSDDDKLKLLNETKMSLFTSLPRMEVKWLENNDKMRNIGISSIHDRVLQTCVIFLMDPFYEARFHPHMYGFRRGRTTLNAVGLLKSILERADTHRLGVLLIDIEKCFDKISHDSIYKYFIVPKVIQPLLQRWLRPLIINEFGKILGTQTEGITQGSVLGPLICNVIINELVYKVSIKHNTNSKSKFTLFENLPATGMFKTRNNDIKQRIIYRNIIAYGDDITITTTNKEELMSIYKALSTQLGCANLKISEEKTSFITHKNDKEKFDYLGFTFLYVSNRRLRPGGIITRADEIYRRKNLLTNQGTYLVYPNSKGYENIKKKMKDIIKKLLHNSEISVFNEVNNILRGYSNYYFWSNGYNRLKSLEGQTVMYIKKLLIKKHRYKGIRRPVWVAQNFLVCKQSKDNDNDFLYRGKPPQIKSPYNLRWHPHVELKPDRNNLKRDKKVIFLVMPSKINVMLPITTCTLPKDTRNTPYYIDPYLYADFWSRVRSRRLSNKSFHELLYISQKGICPVCSLPLLDSYGLNILNIDEKLEIHHINSIAEAYNEGSIAHKRANTTKNLELLHITCHHEITRNNMKSKKE